MRSMVKHADEIMVEVTYGIGTSCVGRFDRAEVAEMPARALLERVAGSPQEPGRASRAAQVLAQVLRSERVLDAELMEGEARRRPITLREKLLRSPGGAGERGADRDRLSIRISESYVGGALCPAGSCVSGSC